MQSYRDSNGTFVCIYLCVCDSCVYLCVFCDEVDDDDDDHDDDSDDDHEGTIPVPLAGWLAG